MLIFGLQFFNQDKQVCDGSLYSARSALRSMFDIMFFSSLPTSFKFLIVASF